MSIHERIANYQGGKFMQRGVPKRAHRAIVTYRGVELECEYSVDGSYMAATDVDAESWPCAMLLTVQIGGQHIKAMLDEEQVADIEQLIERGWKS